MLPFEAAILDPEGTIQVVNARWRRYMEQGAGVEDACGVDANYLEACSNATSEAARDAQCAHDGLSEVLRGRERAFSLRYRCDSPTEELWYVASATALNTATGGILITHQDITHWMSTAKQACT